MTKKSMSASNKRPRTSRKLEEDSASIDLEECSDIEFPAYEHHQTRSWCTDELQKLHDWMIEVASEDGHISTKYYVHKVFLGAGENCSEYFERLFGSSEQVRELHESISKHVLLPSATEAFPEMLNHIYTGKCSITTSNCLALTFLSKYFVIRTLYRDVQKFLENDITDCTAHIYLSEASLYRDQRIVDKATRIMAENFSKFEIDQLQILDPELFHSVLNSEHLICESQETSLKVAEYIRCRSDEVDGDFLASVTDAKHMPEINPKEVFFFLNLSAKHFSNTNNTTMDEQLHSRCIVSCKNWRSFSDSVLSIKIDEECEEKENSDKSYLTLPDAIKIEALETAFRSACEENEKLISTVDDLTEKNIRLCEKVALLLKQTTNYGSKMKAMNKELCKFRRLSTTDNLAVYGILGSVQNDPTMMPRLESFPSLTRKEGVVYCRELSFRMNSEKRWPVYYYLGDLCN